MRWCKAPDSRSSEVIRPRMWQAKTNPRQVNKVCKVSFEDERANVHLQTLLALTKAGSSAYAHNFTYARPRMLQVSHKNCSVV